MNLLTKIAVPLAVVSLAACGSSVTTSVNTTSPSTSSPDTTTAPRPDHGGIEVRLETGGGFVAPDFLFRTIPALVIYADGLVITQGPQDAIYPGPALPNLIAQHLDDAGLATVKQAITAAGLVTATPPDYAQTPMQIADAPTTTLTVAFDGITAVHAAYALSMGSTPESGVRKTLADVIARLNDLGGLVGAEHIGPQTTFAPTSFAIRATPSDPDASSPPVDWPLSNVQLNAAATCLVVDDAAAPALFSSMTTATQVRQAGGIYALSVRPVLPADQGCGTDG